MSQHDPVEALRVLAGNEAAMWLAVLGAGVGLILGAALTIWRVRRA